MTRRCIFAGLALFCALAANAQTPQQTRATPNQAAVPKAVSQGNTRKTLLVFGDSLSAGYGVPAGQSYPDDLQRKIDAQHLPWQVVNMGISGDTTMGGVARLRQAAARKPSVVLLELGGNDGLRGLPLSLTRENLEKMIVEFERVGARVVLAGMMIPPNYGPDYTGGFAKIYPELAAKYKLPLIPFLLSDIVTEDLHYFQRDGIHPTAEGAEIVAGTVMKTLQPLLAAKN